MAITKIIADSITSGAIALGTNFFSAKNVTADATFSHGADVLVPYDTEISDVDGVYTNTSGNYKFTCQTAGWHYFEASLHKDGGDKSRQVQISFYKNGATLQQASVMWDTYNSDTFRDTVFKNHTIKYLSAGDYIQVYLYQTQSDGGSSGYNQSSTNNVFSGYRIAQ